MTDLACQDFIRRLLGGYEMPIQSVKAECQEAGFSLRTAERPGRTAHNLGLVLATGPPVTPSLAIWRWNRRFGQN